MMQKTKKVYLNKAQMLSHFIAANSETILAARRLGKTKGIIPNKLLRNIQYMPGGTHGIIGLTYRQMLSKILPNTLATLAEWGYIQNEHYFFGRKSPKGKGFLKPIIEPLSWDYSIHWYNGAVSTLISQDLNFSANSLTLSSLIADEARALNKDKLDDEVIAALTPNNYRRLKDNMPCAWDMSQTYVSDYPRRQSEKWLLEHKEKHSEEAIQLIADTLIKLANGKNVYKNKQRLYEYRRYSWNYQLFDIFDNIEVVGEEYVRTKFRDMPLPIFITQLLTEDSKDIKGLFYSELNEKHYYISNDNSFINSSVRSDFGDIQLNNFNLHTWRKDTDLNHAIPLLISADTNINQNWLPIGQADYERCTFKTVNSFFVKSPNLLPDVVNDFCRYYQDYPNRDIVFYFDHTLKQGKSAISSNKFYQTVSDVLRKNNWNVNEVYIGQALMHKDRHLIINESLRGENLKRIINDKPINYLYPTFNKENNEVLLEGMEKVKTKTTAKGWGKDKSREKLPDTDNDPVEFRTDSSEAWDMLFIGAIFYPWTENLSNFAIHSGYW